tara:strand:+ start:750 stop:1229 length:480 start_codon:yes stop_codon:yes gene_type:complete
MMTAFAQHSHLISSWRLAAETRESFFSLWSAAVTAANERLVTFLRETGYASISRLESTAISGKDYFDPSNSSLALSTSDLAVTGASGSEGDRKNEEDAEEIDDVREMDKSGKQELENLSDFERGTYSFLMIISALPRHLEYILRLFDRYRCRCGNRNRY